jgi:uncharacterized delta-60 repeat protein
MQQVYQFKVYSYKIQAMKKSVFIVLSFFSFTSHAQYALDWTFNAGGVLSIPLFYNYNFAKALALQPDGKIIIGGNLQYGTAITKLALVRCNSDGSYDSSFDGDGIFMIDGLSLNDVELQSDGKILFSGITGTVLGFTVARLNGDGSFDTTFATGGIYNYDFGGGGASGGISVQPDGKILGTVDLNPEYGLVRLNADGSSDTTFDSDGLAIHPAHGPSVQNQAYDVMLQPDGKMVVLGGSSTSYLCLVRFETDGSLDSSFGVNGFVSSLQVEFAGTNAPGVSSMALQPDGKILVMGNSGLSRWAVTRVNADGSPDVSFNMVVEDSINNGRVARSLFLQTDGKIIIAGYTDNFANANFLVKRYNSDGTPDISFASGGSIITDLGALDRIYAVAQQPDQKIVVAGQTYTGTYTSNFLLARYNQNGVGINENSVVNRLSIYPNPANTTITVTSTTNLNNASLKLIDLSGQVICSQQNIQGKSLTVDISQHAQGIYLVEIMNGAFISRHKLIKE